MLTADPIDETRTPAVSPSDGGWYDPDSVVFQADANQADRDGSQHPDDGDVRSPALARARGRSGHGIELAAALTRR